MTYLSMEATAMSTVQHLGLTEPLDLDPMLPAKIALNSCKVEELGSKPAKVELQKSAVPTCLTMTSDSMSRKSCEEDTQTSPESSPARSAYDAQLSSCSGVWADAIRIEAPYLNVVGMHQAIGILDKAMKNAHQAKALDKILDHPHYGHQLPRNQYLERMRLHVRDQQRHLLKELQELKFDASKTCNLDGNSSTEGRSQIALTALKSTSVNVGSTLAKKTPSQKTKEQNMPQELQRQKVVQKPISASLQELSNENPDCVIIVRRMHKLGFQAMSHLKHHFSKHGTVVKILAAHATVRRSLSLSRYVQDRPSSLGFVLMQTPQAVSSVLASGQEQEIEGCSILVQKFERLHTEGSNKSEEAYTMREEESKIFQRQNSDSEGSEVSTAATDRKSVV